MKIRYLPYSRIGKKSFFESLELYLNFETIKLGIVLAILVEFSIQIKQLQALGNVLLIEIGFRYL